MSFENFEQMFNFYKRRNIFTQNDFAMLELGVIQSAEDFWNRIVHPKYFMGRLNHHDVLAIAAVIG